MNNVFISHTHDDATFVGKLIDDLKKRNIRVWSAQQHVRPGSPWASVIDRGIRSSDNILVVLSDKSASSEWLRAETALALTQSEKRVVPIYATKKADVPFILRSIQGVDLSDPEEYEMSVNRLAEILSSTKIRKESIIDDDYDTRIFKARLEKLVLEQEALSLTRTAQRRSRVVATCFAFIALTVVVLLLSITVLSDSITSAGFIV